MFCAHQCLSKASYYVAQHLSITVFTKTTEMGLARVTGSAFSTMLSLMKTFKVTEVAIVAKSDNVITHQCVLQV
jgi:hypothetical protein